MRNATGQGRKEEGMIGGEERSGRGIEISCDEKEEMQTETWQTGKWGMRNKEGKRRLKQKREKSF